MEWETIGPARRLNQTQQTFRLANSLCRPPGGSITCLLRAPALRRHSARPGKAGSGLALRPIGLADRTSCPALAWRCFAGLERETIGPARRLNQTQQTFRLANSLCRPPGGSITCLLRAPALRRHSARPGKAGSGLALRPIGLADRTSCPALAWRCFAGLERETIGPARRLNQTQQTFRLANSLCRPPGGPA